MAAEQPRDDALAIWRAGVEAVRSDTLVKRLVSIRDGTLHIGSQSWRLADLGRIEIVGAGKAGAGMAAGLEEALGEKVLAEKRVQGWLNVPADCVRSLAHTTLHAARPASLNEPSEEGLEGTREILRRVAALESDDLCICLISGGGSALLPAPRDGISLEDLQQVTRQLSGAGATIQQLNAVRKRLSRIQGGRLAQACTAGQLVTLIISDVIGDPLDVIASGPTVIVADEVAASQQAVDVLEHFASTGSVFAPTVRQQLEADRNAPIPKPLITKVTNLIIGNNQTAVDAARGEAERRGYRSIVAPPQSAETTAEEVGRWLARMARERPAGVQPGERWCLINGGEPVVKLIDSSDRGRGGRNQQLALAALCELHAENRSSLDRQVYFVRRHRRRGRSDRCGGCLGRCVRMPTDAGTATRSDGLSPQE